MLPIPDKTFGGTIGRTIDKAVADWTFIPGVKAPEGAPNVLLVLVDDAGFAGPEPFGGDISTPTLERMQEMGLTYNAFHVIALCSPTRAALLTGRNHHRVGMGRHRRISRTVPRLHGTRPRSCTALPRILKENGYVTGGFGKWHMTPDNEQGPAGPFEQLAAVLGLRPLVGLPDRRRRPVRSDHHAGQLRRSACLKARTASSTTSPTT